MKIFALVHSGAPDLGFLVQKLGLVQQNRRYLLILVFKSENTSQVCACQSFQSYVFISNSKRNSNVKHLHPVPCFG